MRFTQGQREDRPSHHPSALPAPRTEAGRVVDTMRALQRRAGNQAVAAMVTVQRAKWTWNGTEWQSADGDPKNKPLAAGFVVGMTYDDESRAFALPPAASTGTGMVPSDTAPVPRFGGPTNLPPLLPFPMPQPSLPFPTPETVGVGSSNVNAPPRRGFRNLGLTISIPGHQSAQAVGPPEYLAQQKLADYAALGGRQIAERGIAAVQELPQEALAALDPAAFGWFHGSTSPSLVLLSRTGGLLLSTAQLMEAGIVPFGGELGNALDPRSVNREGVSGVTAANVEQAVLYTDPSHGRLSTEALGKRTPEEWAKSLSEAIAVAQGDEFTMMQTHLSVGKLKIAIGRQYLLSQESGGPKFLDELVARFGPVAAERTEDAQRQFVTDVANFLDKLRGQAVVSGPEREQLESPFPVLYGSASLSSDDRSQGVRSSIPGERVVKRPGLGKDIQFVFVPSDRIGLVRMLVDGSGATVLPLEAVTFLCRLAKAASCTILAAAAAVRGSSSQ